jgi:hypothetical protein
MSFTLDTDKLQRGEDGPLPGVPAMLNFKPGRFNEIENKLSDSLFKAINFVEQTWWEKSQVPPVESITVAAGLTKEEADSFWQDENVLESLRRRSLDPNEMIGSEGLLSREQLIVANMLLNIADKTSTREKLKMVGVKPATYQTWMNDPVFVNYLKVRSEKLFNTTDTDAYLSVSQGVRDGDFQYTKLFLEMRGTYNPRVQVDVNIEQVLIRVVDIVARHVDDPVVLENIATEIENLASNKRNAIPVSSTVGL